MLSSRGLIWRNVTKEIRRELVRVSRVKKVIGTRAIGASVHPDTKLSGAVIRTSGQTGMIAGLFGSVVGVGGGVIMVPMMTCEPLCMQARHASATSLVAVLGTGLVSALLYGSQGQVDPVGAVLIASAAMVTAPYGARMTMKMDNRILKRLMGLFLLLVAPAVPIKDLLLHRAQERFTDDHHEAAHASTTQASRPSESANAQPLVIARTQDSAQPAAAAASATAQDNSWSSRAWDKLSASPGFMQLSGSDRNRYVASLVATGGAAGFLSGLLGIGGGIVITPVLALFSGMPQISVVGTSMVAMVFPSAVSLYTHHTLGNVRWQVGRILLMGSAVGAVGGVQVANAAGDTGLKYLFAIGMFFLGGRTFKASYNK